MGIGSIPKKNIDGVVIQGNSPFAEKKIGDYKVYKRVHGVKQSIGIGQTVAITFVVPYDMCKITEIQIVNGKLGDTCDFEVYDTPTGTISGYPNIMLNQFGFDVNIAEKFHREHSNYDADLIKDMMLEVHYTNNTGIALEIGVNFVLHELKL